MAISGVNQKLAGGISISFSTGLQGCVCAVFIVSCGSLHPRADQKNAEKLTLVKCIDLTITVKLFLYQSKDED